MVNLLQFSVNLGSCTLPTLYLLFKNFFFTALTPFSINTQKKFRVDVYGMLHPHTLHNKISSHSVSYGKYIALRILL